MAEPTTSTAAGLAAAFSGVSLALFGVDYYALLWGFFGSLLALSRAETMTKPRAVFFVTLSTFVGAAIGGSVLALVQSEQRALLVFASLVGGAGSQLIVGKAIDAVGGVFTRLGEK